MSPRPSKPKKKYKFLLPLSPEDEAALAAIEAHRLATTPEDLRAAVNRCQILRLLIRVEHERITAGKPKRSRAD